MCHNFLLFTLRVGIVSFVLTTNYIVFQNIKKIPRVFNFKKGIYFSLSQKFFFYLPFSTLYFVSHTELTESCLT